MKQLIFLAVIVLISILHSWWKQRQETRESMEDSDPMAGQQPRRRVPPRGLQPPPAPSKAASWEQELRRLLQGEEPAQQPPPPIITVAPPPLPEVAAPRSASARGLTEWQQAGEMQTELPARMPSLTQSAQAYLRGSQLESKVAAHMHGAHQQTTKHLKLDLKKETAPEIRQAIGLVRNRQSQRAAIIAGIILGQPKALEN
jgi:hypothetical protein